MNLSHNAQQILSSPCYCTVCTFCAEFKQIHLQTCRRVHTGYTLSLSTVHCVFIYAHTPNPHRICHDWMTVCPYTFHPHTHTQTEDSVYTSDRRSVDQHGLLENCSVLRDFFHRKHRSFVHTHTPTTLTRHTHAGRVHQSVFTPRPEFPSCIICLSSISDL